MSDYIPGPGGWYSAPCPHDHCTVEVRSRKANNLFDALRVHYNRHHDGKRPETPSVKRVAISRVYYSGSSKKLSALVPPFKTAIVSGDYPDERGCAVVRSPDEILIYPNFGVGTKGWKMKR